MRVFPNAIVLTAKSHFDVRKFIRHYEAWWWGTIALGKTWISAIEFNVYLLLINEKQQKVNN